MGKEVFWSFRGFIFRWHMIFVWGLWLWSKGLSFIGFLMKKKDFFGVSRFSFLFRVFMFEYFCFFSVWCRERWVVNIFWKCFRFEWVVDGWVGCFSWIVCWHEFVVLFKSLKVPTFMAGKGVTVNGGQFNEHMNTWTHLTQSPKV